MLLAVFFLAWVGAAIDPVYRSDWWLENVLIFLGVPLVIGLAIGLAGGIGIGFAMKSLLFGLSPSDPLTIGSVVALLSIVTITATALPAWRASRIDPVIALRIE